MSRIISIAAAVLMTGAAASAFATSADDAGSALIVPLVAKTGVFATRLFVENHEPHAVRVVLMLIPVREARTGKRGGRCAPAASLRDEHSRIGAAFCPPRFRHKLGPWDCGTRRLSPY